MLKALRMDGTGLGVDEMSDGTRDQLFLALRRAGSGITWTTILLSPL
ncbi:hypothetical protein [Desulfonatronospira sp.]|nr:hypothetical protein [Desulfonatronospira sp.]